MTSRVTQLLAGAALSIVLSAGAVGAQFDARCQVAPARIGDIGRTPTLARALTSGGPVTLVAIGSSSTAGTAQSDRQSLYPLTIERALAAQWPGTTVVVHNRGRGGEGIPEQIARFDADVLAAKPALVIWQLGVNDLLRRDGVTDLKADVVAAIQRLRQAGPDVVLLDPQIGPRVWSDADDVPMRQMIADVAGEAGVGLITRGQIMSALIDGGSFALSDLIERDGLHMTDQMHRCLGLIIGTAVMDAVADTTSTRAMARRR